MKPSKQVEVLDGMSGTLSFQPNEDNPIFCQQVEELKSYRGTEPLYPELFAENIKFEYICPICKEVLDQPVQTKCPIPHIFCASCLTFSINMCWSSMSNLPHYHERAQGLCRTSSLCAANNHFRARF